MEYDVVLLPTFADVEDWRKTHSRMSKRGLFSQTVTTFNSWVADLWELHGDGRAIVDSVQRIVVMKIVLDRLAEEREGFLTVSDGVVGLAARCVRVAAGVVEFESALADVALGADCELLDERECMLLGAIDAYKAELAKLGLVELGDAARMICDMSETVFPKPLRVLVSHDNPLDWATSQFFALCPMLEVALGACKTPEHDAPSGQNVEVRYGFPAGRYAQPGLVADVVREALEKSGGENASDVLAVVTCADPMTMYQQLETALAEEPVCLSLQAQVPFRETDFGKAFLSMRRAIDDDVLDSPALADVLASPFSGFERRDAWEADARIRANRIEQRDECLLWLRNLSDRFSQLEEVAETPEADILLGVFEEIARGSARRSPAWISQQLGAISALRACTSCARRAEASMSSCLAALETTVVVASFEAQGGVSGSRVVVTTQNAAAHFGEGSCETLVACDLTSSDYPVSESDDAARTLFGKIGLSPTDTAIERSRRTFSALERLPRSGIVFMRPLNDWDGNPTYPSVTLQEFVDAAYGASPDDLDEDFGLPASVVGRVLQRGEELLWQNALAARRLSSQPISREVEYPGMGDVPSGLRRCVLLARRTSSGVPLDRPSPSPSQVEAYLECPYKWFASRRLHIGGLDEGFGALERGEFAHAVLEQFHVSLKETGRSRVERSNIDYCEALMRSTFSDVLAEQPALEPGCGRYVAANRLEAREVDALEESLVRFLQLEADMLPGFSPALLEYEIDAEHGADYAGCRLVGKVDRIDIDDAGHAVVIDYKGSVNASHRIAGKTPADPGKVQARIYASAIERLLGVQVVGAVYLGYNRAPSVAGALDARFLGQESFGGRDVRSSSCSLDRPLASDSSTPFAALPFPDMLAQTEDVVAHAVASMASGFVEPNPSTRDACTYCPVLSCSNRGA